MQLAEMGFPVEACRKAVYYTGNMGPEMAFNWIIAHMEEPGKTSRFTGTHWVRTKTIVHPQIINNGKQRKNITFVGC